MTRAAQQAAEADGRGLQHELMSNPIALVVLLALVAGCGSVPKAPALAHKFWERHGWQAAEAWQTRQKRL